LFQQQQLQQQLQPPTEKKQYKHSHNRAEREEELRRIIADIRKKPEAIESKDKQIIRVFNV
jgi:hypothetical protein